MSDDIIAKIEKLPKWAQDHISKLERERFVALRALKEWVDNQTPSPVYVDEYVCTGEQRGPARMTRYVQTHRVKFMWKGVELEVSLVDHPENCIRIRYSSEGTHGDVALVPKSFQHIELKHPTELRTP